MVGDGGPVTAKLFIRQFLLTLTPTITVYFGNWSIDHSLGI